MLCAAVAFALPPASCSDEASRSDERLATADGPDPSASGARAPAPASHSDPSPDRILSAIETLESEHDATCYSSAGRFEDFLFGTPLSAGARHANVELQKRLVLRLWSQASASAAQSGASTVGAHQLRPEDVVVVESGDDGRLHTAFTAGPALAISQARARARVA